MKKIRTKTSAVRHLIMLTIDAGVFAILFALLWYIRHEKGIPEVSILIVLSLLIASSTASIPAYWGSKKVLPILVPRLWKAFWEALFSLPILNWFAPENMKKKASNGSFSMQIEHERMRSFRQIQSNHAPGVAAANMALSTDGDFLLNLIFKPLVFILYLAVFLLLLLSYLAVAVGIFLLLIMTYHFSTELGIAIIMICSIYFISMFLIHPVLYLIDRMFQRQLK